MELPVKCPNCMGKLVEDQCVECKKFHFPRNGDSIWERWWRTNKSKYSRLDCLRSDMERYV